MGAIHKDTLLVADADGQDWVLDKYACVTDQRPAGNSSGSNQQRLSLLVEYPSLTLKVLITETTDRGHYGRARACWTLHALEICGISRPLLASHKFVTGGEGHLARAGVDGVDWHDGTQDGMRIVCALHMRALGLGWCETLLEECNQSAVRPTVVADLTALHETARRRYATELDACPPTLRGEACIAQLLRACPYRPPVSVAKVASEVLTPRTPPREHNGHAAASEPEARRIKRVSLKRALFSL